MNLKFVIYSTREGLLLMGVVWAMYGILYVQDTLHLRTLLCGFVKGSEKLIFCPFVFQFRTNIEFCMKHVKCDSFGKYNIPEMIY